MIKAIIFDFDGVILDDIGIKEDAFNFIFPKEYSKIVTPVLEVYMKKSRKIIIKQCFEAITSKGITLPKDYDFYLNKYTEMTQSKIIASPELKGATNSLNKLKEDYQLFVLTATPEEQIDEVIEKRGFIQFKEVFGSNTGSKPEVARRLLKQYNLEANEVIFIGDGKNDLACAEELGFTFIGIINYLNDFGTNPKVKYSLKDLNNLVEVVKFITC